MEDEDSSLVWIFSDPWRPEVLVCHSLFSVEVESVLKEYSLSNMFILLKTETDIIRQ